MLSLDHLAVAAETLEEGRAHVQEALGITPDPGGRHARFGTHNLLIGLEEGLYLEVIAVDPDAPPPEGARWFDLDHFRGQPRLHNWICRTDNLGQALSVLPAGSGRAVELQRGDLRWQMAVPDTGRLPFEDLSPAVLQWQGAGPAARLRQSGARLDRLILAHPEIATLQAQIAPLLRDPRVVYEEAAAPALRAEFIINGKRRHL